MSLFELPAPLARVHPRNRWRHASAKNPLMSLGWKATGILGRLAKNVGWLIGSRGFAAVASIGYLAIAARSLGPKGFGAFTLVLTYAQLIANVVQFQSFKSVIRYGALHLARDRHGRLGRLIGLTATLDWASGVVGAVCAIIIAPFAAPLLHWNVVEQHYAQLFAAALLVTTGSTPTGILRLFNRFDLIAYTEAISPAIRVLGSIIAWMMGASLISFLTVWATAGAIQTIAQWIAALSVQLARPQFGVRAFVLAVRENRRILPFLVQTNISSSLNSSMDLGILAVGAAAGPVEAGGFRIAQRLAKAITNPVETVTKALYPEFAHLVAKDDQRKLRHLLIRVCSIAAALGGLAILFAGPGASTILRLVAGPRFGFARDYLLLLLIAAAIDLAGFALEPFHNAYGWAARVLRIRAVSAVAYVVFLGLLLPAFGAMGAAVAAIGLSMITFVQFALSAAGALRNQTVWLISRYKPDRGRSELGM